MNKLRFGPGWRAGTIKGADERLAIQATGPSGAEWSWQLLSPGSGEAAYLKAASSVRPAPVIFSEKRKEMIYSTGAALAAVELPAGTERRISAVDAEVAKVRKLWLSEAEDSVVSLESHYSPPRSALGGAFLAGERSAPVLQTAAVLSIVPRQGGRSSVLSEWRDLNGRSIDVVYDPGPKATYVSRSSSAQAFEVTRTAGNSKQVLFRPKSNVLLGGPFSGQIFIWHIGHEGVYRTNGSGEPIKLSDFGWFLTATADGRVAAISKDEELYLQSSGAPELALALDAGESWADAKWCRCGRHLAAKASNKGGLFIADLSAKVVMQLEREVGGFVWVS